MQMIRIIIITALSLVSILLSAQNQVDLNVSIKSASDKIGVLKKEISSQRVTRVSYQMGPPPQLSWRPNSLSNGA